MFSGLPEGGTCRQEAHPVEGTQNKVRNEVPRGQPFTGGWARFYLWVDTDFLTGPKYLSAHTVNEETTEHGFSLLHAPDRTQTLGLCLQL